MTVVSDNLPTLFGKPKSAEILTPGKLTVY